MRFVLFVILGYIVYQFIFKLVIPVYMASRNIKKGFRDMKDKMDQHNRAQQQGFNGSHPDPKPKFKPRESDYIDFEEVK